MYIHNFLYWWIKIYQTFQASVNPNNLIAQTESRGQWAAVPLHTIPLCPPVSWDAGSKPFQTEVRKSSTSRKNVKSLENLKIAARKEKKKRFAFRSEGSPTIFVPGPSEEHVTFREFKVCSCRVWWGGERVWW